jgi:hypothetical protein
MYLGVQKNCALTQPVGHANIIFQQNGASPYLVTSGNNRMVLNNWMDGHKVNDFLAFPLT